MARSSPVAAVVAVVGLALIAAGCGGGAAANPGLVTAAHQVVTQLEAGRDSAVEAQLASSVRQQLGAARLAAAWKQATAGLGAYKGLGTTVSGSAAGGTEVVVAATFTHGTLDVRLHFDAQQKIDGLYLQPHPASS